MYNSKPKAFHIFLSAIINLPKSISFFTFPTFSKEIRKWGFQRYQRKKKRKNHRIMHILPIAGQNRPFPSHSSPKPGKDTNSRSVGSLARKYRTAKLYFISNQFLSHPLPSMSIPTNQLSESQREKKIRNKKVYHPLLFRTSI